MNFEARKLSILKYLIELKDEVIIQQIENLLKHKDEFWDDLPDPHKEMILKGIKELDQGKGIDYKTIKAKYNR